MADIFDPSTWSFPFLGSNEPIIPEVVTTPKSDRLPAAAKGDRIPGADPLVQTTPKTDRLPTKRQIEADRLARSLAQINIANSNPDALALLHLSEQRGNDLTANNVLLKDYRELTPVQFQQKHGIDVYDKLVATGISGRRVDELANRGRDLEQHAYDAAIGIGSGAGQGALSAYAMLLQAVPGSVGDYLQQGEAKTSSALRDFTDSVSTSEYRDRNYVNALRRELDNQDAENASKRDKGNAFVKGLRDIGRDLFQANNRIWEDPFAMESSVAEGVGSLFAAGAVTGALEKGASAANRVIAPSLLSSPLAASAVDAAISKAAFPLAVGAMEGGSAASQAIQDVNNIPETELLQNPNYQALLSQGLTPELARRKLATDAGSIAAPIAAAAAALPSKLVEKFERNPLSHTSSGGILRNMGSEFVEETSQGITGQLAGNIGEKASGADPDKSLVEGVGSAALEGGIAGSLTPVATQGPGVALAQTARAAGLSLKYTVGAGINALKNKGDQIKAENQAQSTVSPEKLAPAVQDAAEKAPQVAESLRTIASEKGADSPDVETYIQKVEQASRFRPEDLQGLPTGLVEDLLAHVKETGRPLDRLGAMTFMAGVAENDENTPEERVAAGTFLIKHIENNKQLFSEDLPAFLKNVPHERPEFQTFNAYAQILSAIEQTPAIQQALKWATEKMQMPEQDLSKVDFKSDQGQKIVDDVASVATVAPHAVDPKAVETILHQADSGLLELSPARRRALRSAVALHDAGRIRAALMRAPEAVNIENEAQDLQQELDTTKARDEMLEFINRQVIEEGGRKSHQLSLSQHIAGISSAVADGNSKEARARAQRLVNFAKSHISKLDAVNQSIRKGNGQNFSYRAWNGREFYDAKPIGISIGKEGSENFGRTVFAEASAIVELSNRISDQYPAFNMPELKAPGFALDTLDNLDNKENNKENAADNGSIKDTKKDTKRGSSTTTKTTNLSGATTQETDDDSKQLELPLPPAQPIREPKKAAPVDGAGDQASTDQTGNASSETNETNNKNDKNEVGEIETNPEPEKKSDTPPKEKVIVKSFEDLGKALEDKTPEAAEPKLAGKETIDLADQSENEIEEEEQAPQTTREAFPTLVQAGGRNWFQEAFRLPKTAKSRLMGISAPLVVIFNAVGSSKGINAFLGDKEVNYDFDRDDSNNLKKLLKLSSMAYDHMQDRLHAKIDGSDLMARVEAGEELLRSRDLRALNILEPTETGYRYNPELIQSALLAGLDWVLNIAERSSPMKVEEVARILNVDEGTALDYLEDFDRGMSLDMAKRTLADQIRKFWGVDANRDARYAFTKGIPESVAAEILHGFDAVGLIDLRIKKGKDDDRRIAFPDISKKKYNRVWFDNRDEETDALIDSLAGVSKILSDMVLVGREVDGFSIVETIPEDEVDRKQLRNPSVDTTRQQKQAMSNAQQTPYRLNLLMFDFVTSMGRDAFVALMSGYKYKTGDLKKTYKEVGLNKGHWKTIQGKQRSLVSSYNNIAKLMARVKKYAGKQGIPLEEAAIYYKHSINKLGRLQMAGMSNPQTDKYGREVFMPTGSTLDLSGNAPDMDKFLMTIAQGIGLKTEQSLRADTLIKVQEQTLKGGKFHPLVQELKAWVLNHEEGKNLSIPSTTYNMLGKLGLSMHGMHSLLSLARYEIALDRGDDLSAFKTSNYLEADGKTNGPINALMLMASGPFVPSWLQAVRKGGAFPGQPGKTLNAHFKEDSVDLYKDSSNVTQIKLEDLGREINADGSPEAKAFFKSFLTMMNALNADIIVGADGSVTIERGVTKNPLTITIYGSGPRGIAGKISGELVKAIYAKLSEADENGVLAGDLIYGEGRDSEFMQDLSKLSSQKINQNSKTGKFYVWGEIHPVGGKSALDFEFSKAQRDTLTHNVLAMLVRPMVSAIKQQITHHVNDVTSTIQQATQFQSIILKGMFITEVTKRIALMQSDPEAYDYVGGEFLSEKELNEILDNLKRFSPIIKTGTQSYMLSGGETGNLFNDEDEDGESIPFKVKLDNGKEEKVSYPKGYSGSLSVPSGDMQTSAYVYGPTVSGVKAIPTSVVGSGDGQMMLNFLAGNPDAAKRVLHVYDGLNMPADQIENYSELINQAVFMTWTSNKNPVRAIQESFTAFVSHSPIEEFFAGEDRNRQQMDALRDLTKLDLNKAKIADDEIISPRRAKAKMNKILAKLEYLADDTDIRRKVYAAMPFGVDHMASGETPYANEGTIKLPENPSDKQILQAMNDERDRLWAEKNARKPVKPAQTKLIKAPAVEAPETKAKSKPSETLSDFVDRVGLYDEDTGASILHVRHLTNLDVDMTDTQKEMLDAAVENLRKEDYTLVFGDEESLDNWEKVYNADLFHAGANDADFGRVYLSKKIIIIKNIAPETLVHELVHASTAARVHNALTNPNQASKEDRDAVNRIQALMSEWNQNILELASEDKASDDLQLIHNIISSASSPTVALNEFMAYVLSNQELSEQAAKTKVKNPIARIIGDALATLKTLIFGKKAPQVGDDILSNLRFNTLILMAPQTQVELLKQDASAVVLHQSALFGSNDRLTEVRDRLNRKIIAWIDGDKKDKISQITKVFRQSEANDAKKSAEDLANVFARMFPDLGNLQAYSTFTMVQQALMTEIELNANSLSRIEEIYADVIGKIKYTDFRKNEDPNDFNDDKQARDKYDVLIGRYLVKTDKHGRSSLMSSFLSLALASDEFRKVLSGFETPKTAKDNSKTVDGWLENVANAGLDRMSLALAGEKGANVRDAIDTLTASMIENVGDQRSYIEQRSESMFDKIENTVADFIQDKSGELIRKLKTYRNSKNLAVKASASLATLVSTAINEEDSEAAAQGVTSWFNRRDTFQEVSRLFNEIRGRTKDNALVFDMISKVRAVIQQTRQQFRDELPVKLNKEFKKPVTAAQWSAMHKGLGKTDFVVLTSTFGVAGALELIVSPRRLQAEIRTLEKSLQATDPKRFGRIQAKAKQLANFMLTGDHGSKLLSNADAVARLLGERGFMQINVSSRMVDEVDRLVTLYAIQGLDNTTLDTLGKLIQDKDQAHGMEFVTSYLIGQRAEEMSKAKASTVSLFNHYKGHIPSEPKQGGSLIIASDSEHGHLVSRGYRRISAYNGSSADRSLGKRSYYFAPVSGTAPFHQGVMQTVHQTASGVDPQTGYTVGEIMAGVIDDANVVHLIDQQIRNQTKTNENLRPVFGDNGKVVAFERMADPAQLTSLNRNTNLAEMIGVWRGRQVEEKLAQKSNEDLIDNLYATWQHDKKAGKADEYVNIAKLNPKTDDPILIEAVRLIPNQSKDYIESVFGKDEFWVRRDVLIDTFGARQASIGDLFTGKTRWNPKAVSEFERLAMGMFGIFGQGNKAYSTLVSAEKNVQELVASAKTRIVVKSVIVPAANAVSNMFQLLNRGVPLRHIIKGTGAKTAEINFYIKNRKKEIDLEADLRAAQGKNDLVAIPRIENQLKSITDSYRRLTIWPLIEAGEFSAISNGQVTAEDLALADGKWSDWIERKVHDLPAGVNTTARYLLVTRDTSLFQGLARAVQYGDFVAKAILYDDLVKRKKASKDNAIATVNEAFVNYNRLAGRSRQYLESIGLLWFYNYKIRIMKEAVYMLRHNPLRSLLMTALPGLPGIGEIGLPSSDNFVALWLQGKLGWSIGPGMLFNSFSLNPWINLVR